MSVFLTVIDTWIGSRQINLAPIRSFFYKWPRNFAISFAVEACIAQPIARWVMVRLHRFLDSRTLEAPEKDGESFDPSLPDTDQ